MKLAFWLSAACGLLLVVGRVEAQTLLFDDFENGVGGDTVWSPWGNVSGDTHTPNGFNNLVTTDTSHASERHAFGPCLGGGPGALERLRRLWRDRHGADSDRLSV